MRKYNSKLTTYYAMFVLVLFIDNFTSLITNYFEFNFLNAVLTDISVISENLFDLLCLCLYFYYVSRICNILIGINIIKKYRTLYIALFCISISALTAGAILSHVILPVIMVPKIAMYIIIIFSIIMFLCNLKKIKDVFYKKILRKVLLLCLILFPLIILENIRWIFNNFLPEIGGFFGPTFFLLVNLYGLILVSGDLFLSDKEKKSLKLKQILSDHNITTREAEIVNLVIEGHNNKQISEMLYISEGTVKNYIYSIYKKLNINSRLKLINLIKGF